jgi:hypothetical protein
VSDNLISDFLERTSGEAFTALRAALLDDAAFDFFSVEDDELASLVERGDNAAALAMLPGLMPNWLLSPNVHQMLADAARASGDETTAAREQYLARAALSGLLQSGDGSEARPYLVTHSSDEVDVVSALDREADEQERVRRPEGVFDVITLRDGGKLWFDVTVAFTSQRA